MAHFSLEKVAEKMTFQGKSAILITVNFKRTGNGKIKPTPKRGTAESLVSQSFSVIAPDRSRVSGVRSEWHSRGQRFDPAYLHHKRRKPKTVGFI